MTQDNPLEYDDIEIPLPPDQDSYQNIRPYPCDFCNRRFRKKVNLSNHIMTHQTDRPHSCNLCGARFVRKCDLNNHLKIHAYAPSSRDGLEDDLNDEDSLAAEEEDTTAGGTRGRRKKVQSSVPRKRKSNTGMLRRNNTEDIKLEMGKYVYKSYDDEYTYTEDAQLFEDDLIGDNSARSDTYASSSKWPKMSATSEEQPTQWPITDPTKPYVCQFCGVGFAREKALASHSRIHGGDSPFECTTCSEMFWDVNSLREHVRVKHGGTIPQPSSDAEELDNDGTYTGDERIGEFYCNTCGVPFHRLDLLKRHQK